tara:strand:+ start:161 stop:448 length:288 start_codon:yes stop_codon:yes gene_type:complete
MKFLKLVKVTSSANDDNVMQVVNVDKIEVIVTTGDTCVINYKGDGVTGAVKTTITSAGRGKAVGDALMNLLEKGHMTVYTVDASFAGGVTTILSA